MNLSQSGLIDTFEKGPMCPNGWAYPVHEAHRLRVRMIDAAYDKTPRNEDNEPMTTELAQVNDALSYGPTTEDRMRLYRDTVQAMDFRGTVVVETLYFRCQICGLVLPASRAPRPGGTELL